MLIDNEDWSTVSDSDVWHAAQGGAHGAAAELRKREMRHRVGSNTAALVAKAKAAR